MKNKFLFFGFLIAGIMLVNFQVYQIYGQTQQNKMVKQQTAEYTCSMHPEVVQDHPGKCPKCGMELAEKKEMTKDNMKQANDSSCMKHDHTKMMSDTTAMEMGHMKSDSSSMKHEKMKE